MWFKISSGKRCLTEQNRAFTLIELLIVVAIIAILAAIAVPNFLEAQTRAKVSRVKADMRTMATAVETYIVDNNKQPPTYRPVAAITRTTVNSALTTPIAYMTSVFSDPFNNVDTDPPGRAHENRVIVWWGSVPGVKNMWSTGNPAGQLEAVLPNADRMFQFYPNFYKPGAGYQSNASWFLFSLGPDQKYAVLTPSYPAPFVDYDPTNGTVSFGDLLRFRG